MHVSTASPTSPQPIVRPPFIVSPCSDVPIRVSRDQTNAGSVVVQTLVSDLNDRTAACPGRAGIYDATAAKFWHTYCEWYSLLLFMAQQYFLFASYGWFKNGSTSQTKN